MNISTIDDPCIENVNDFLAFEVVFTTLDESLEFFRDTATVDIVDLTDRKESVNFYMIACCCTTYVLLV